MANFLYKTRGNSSPERKPRVYFTCHPEDFEKYFDKICDDILKTHDCAIFYTENMSETIPQSDLETDLGRMNLFVVPITKKLLTENCRAMTLDVAYAKQEHIHILPLMMEIGLDFYYQKPENFGERQYLSPFNKDETAVDYGEKLKKILESTLISDEMMRKVRQAFDLYIFLSYRKKDRAYANELMKMIHKHPEFRDVAIWYDEFLTPGESFKENITRALEKSKLFALLVTPNLLEEPNFVKDVEYPAAQKAGKEILPLMMVKTSKRKLKKKFEGIPELIDPEYEELFKEKLLSLGIIQKSSHTKTPERTFLIGIAYIEGIDVETDRAKGLNHIVNAAIAGHEDAMEWLYNEYSTGRYENFEKAMTWAHCLVDHRTKKYGETDPKTIRFIHNLALEYGNAGKYDKYEELAKKAYDLYCKALGEEDHSTLIAMCNLAKAYARRGKNQEALQMNEQALELMKKVLGEYHKDTVWATYCLAGIYSAAGNYQKALELDQKAYELRCQILGEKHPDTLASLNNLAFAYGKCKQYKVAAELFEKTYDLRCEILGANNPHTISTMHSLAGICNNLFDYEKALELNVKSYEARCNILGEEHPDTVATLGTLAWAYCCVGNFTDALEYYQKCYDLRCKLLGKDHPDTIKALEKVGLLKEINVLIFGEDEEYKFGDYYFHDFDSTESEIENEEKCYELACKILGGNHPTTSIFIKNIASCYQRLEENEKALEYSQKSYELLLKCFGEEHPKTIDAINNLAYACANVGDLERSLELYQKCYELRCKVFGEDDLGTLGALENLAISYEDFGEYEKSLELHKKCYERRLTILGEMNPDTITSLSHLALSYGRNGKHEKALELHEKCYELYCKAPKNGSMIEKLFFATFDPMPNLVDAYIAVNDYSKAIKYYEKLYKLSSRKEGASATRTLDALDRFGDCLSDAKDHSKALDIYKKYYKLCCKVYGFQHPKTISAIEAMAVSYYNIERTFYLENGYQRDHSVNLNKNKNIDQILKYCYDQLNKRIGNQLVEGQNLQQYFDEVQQLLSEE